MEQIKNNKNNINSIWKTIRSCIPNKSKTQRTYSKDEKTMANEFNSFFASVGDNTVKKISDLASKFNFELNNNPFIPRTFALLEQFTFNPIECKQVQAIVNSMATNKAPGKSYQRLPSRNSAFSHVHHYRLVYHQYIPRCVEASRGDTSSDKWRS